MKSPIQRIAINTGGGDAPGLNAVIRATVLAATLRGWECVGIRDGFNGILQPERYPHGGVRPLTRDDVRGIAHLGGTMLGTTNKGNPFSFPTVQADGSVKEIDRSDDILDYFQRQGRRIREDRRDMFWSDRQDAFDEVSARPHRHIKRPNHALEPTARN